MIRLEGRERTACMFRNRNCTIHPLVTTPITVTQPGGKFEEITAPGLTSVIEAYRSAAVNHMVADG